MPVRRLDQRGARSPQRQLMRMPQRGHGRGSTRGSGPPRHDEAAAIAPVVRSSSGSRSLPGKAWARASRGSSITWRSCAAACYRMSHVRVHRLGVDLTKITARLVSSLRVPSQADEDARLKLTGPWVTDMCPDEG